MGNCCGKPKGEGAFQGGGRTLGATPATAPPITKGGRSAAVPKVGGPPRTLGSTPAGPGESVPAGVAAAQAAQDRIASPKPKGKLAKELDAQRALTHNQTLNQAAKDNLAARNADADAQARNYN